MGGSHTLSIVVEFSGGGRIITFHDDNDDKNDEYDVIPKPLSHGPRRYGEESSGLPFRPQNNSPFIVI